MKRALSDRDLAALRQRGIITLEETAYWIGEALFAENVYSLSQRPIDAGPGLVLETRKRVLRG